MIDTYSPLLACASVLHVEYNINGPGSFKHAHWGEGEKYLEY